MHLIVKLIQKPLLWITVVVLFFAYLFNFRNKTDLQHLVFSDGYGYYAYLPAFFLQKDPTYQSTMQAQQAYNENKLDFLYAVKTDKKDRYINKYYPGVSLLQIPAFGTSSLVSYCLGKPLTGYSNGYLLVFYLFALGYLIFGIRFLLKSLDLASTEKDKGKIKTASLLAFCSVFFGTGLFYYTISQPSWSHVYSFFLFSALLFLFQNYLLTGEKKRLIFIGIVLGFIFLVRPTNLLIVLFLPFFLESFGELKQFLVRFFSFDRFLFLFVLLPFLVIASILFFLVYWQTGDFFYWSYHGEGFNFSQPKMLESWFSYRIGIFVHHPVLLLSIPGLVLMFRRNRYQFYAWLVYFTVLTYLISSWWCWDYESPFGNRGMVEHLIIFAFPLVVLFQQPGWRKRLLPLVFICLSYTMVRLYQRVENIFPRQKFTAETFWKSLTDFDSRISEKYLNRSHCRPYGKIKKVSVLRPDSPQTAFNEKIEYGCNTTFYFPKKSQKNRFFIEVNFSKRIAAGEDWKDVILVMDAFSAADSSRFYLSQPVYDYYLEGNGKAVSTRCEEDVPVSNMQKDFVLIYLWNKTHKKFKISDYNVKIYEYTTD